ncbi:ABC transporter ATP-binding protein [Rubripirellula obstinata]|uniref:ABC transporter ATP-binding protein n=2 Tax=Rubripirellula obstinata TaxID=406547 RepID=UPI00122C318D|nr:ABC transporter ATP-binding protein [Rubripirellula obstinata]
MLSFQSTTLVRALSPFDPESSSDSVWDVEANNEANNDESESKPDSFRDAYDQCEAEDQAITPAVSESEDDHSQDRVDVTAMMPSMEELEDEESDEEDSYASFKQQSEAIDAEPSSATPAETSPESGGNAGATQEMGATEEADDDSIEAYMNRLLGRVQGTPGTDSKAPAESVSLSSVSVSPQDASEVESESGSSPIAPQSEIDPDAPLVPRSHAPERNSDLSAMRDLANQSARTAISRSTRIQTRNMQMAGVMNFGVAVVAVLFGLGASLFLTGGLLYLAWAMVVIIAVISIRDGLRNLSDARTRMQAAERGELPQALEETLSTPDEQAAHAEDRLALQNAAAKAAREQHAAE